MSGNLIFIIFAFFVMPNEMKIRVLHLINGLNQPLTTAMSDCPKAHHETEPSGNKIQTFLFRLSGIHNCDVFICVSSISSRCLEIIPTHIYIDIPISLSATINWLGKMNGPNQCSSISRVYFKSSYKKGLSINPRNTFWSLRCNAAFKAKKYSF